MGRSRKWLLASEAQAACPPPITKETKGTAVALSRGVCGAARPAQVDAVVAQGRIMPATLTATRTKHSPSLRQEQQMNETRPTSSSGSTMSTPGGNTAANGASPGAATSEMINRVASSAHEAVDRVAAAATPAVEKLRATAATAAETVKAKADQIGAVEEQWIASARNYVREHPLSAVAIGVLVGVLIGKVTGGRDD